VQTKHDDPEREDDDPEIQNEHVLLRPHTMPLGQEV
jgi:hypothetical protein